MKNEKNNGRSEDKNRIEGYESGTSPPFYIKSVNVKSSSDGHNRLCEIVALLIRVSMTRKDLSQK